MNRKAPHQVLTPESDDFKRDLPFLFAAFLLHAYILVQNPGLHWGMTEPKVEKPIPVEFVKEIPQSANLAPVPPGGGKKDELFQKGPGPIQVRKVKKGSPAVKKKPALTPEQLAAIKRKKQEALEAAKQKRLAAEEAARQKKIEAQQRAYARLLERQRQEQILAERRAAMAKAKEEQRQRLLAERQAALEARAAAQAEQRRIAAQRKLEVEQQLAMLQNPEESVTDALAEGVGESSGAGNSDKNASVIPAAAGTGAAGEGPDFEIDGKEGRDAVNQAPMGGGYGGGEGGPVAWSLEGPAGNRRLVKRKVPECPDWVSQRGLDLVVKLRFRVLENGEIKDGVIVKGTSGFPALDQLAIETLKKWKFEAFRPAPGAKTPEVWGVVSFRFVAG